MLFSYNYFLCYLIGKFGPKNPCVITLSSRKYFFESFSLSFLIFWDYLYINKNKTNTLQICKKSQKKLN